VTAAAAALGGKVFTNNVDFDDTSEGYTVVVDAPPVDDTGTIVVFTGVSDEGEQIQLGADGETARELVHALDPNNGTSFASIWVGDKQILSRSGIPSTLDSEVPMVASSDEVVPPSKPPTTTTMTPPPEADDMSARDNERRRSMVVVRVRCRSVK
jgi:hypothetical protein